MRHNIGKVIGIIQSAIDNEQIPKEHVQTAQFLQGLIEANRS